MKTASNLVDEQYDEAALIARLQSGDKSACAECIDIHSPMIYRLGLRLMGNEAEAEDVMQEAFLNAFRAIDSFEGRSGLGTWLYRIAYNAAMMRLRKPSPYTVSVEETMSGETATIVPRQLFDWCCLPEEDFASDEVRAELEQAITELPESLKAVFIMRELEGFSTAETAAALEISEGAAKVRLHRARLWLRERLTPYFTDLAQNGQEMERYG
jgi:RNA polymerase sigma-70 factor (ECF subfamily)